MDIRAYIESGKLEAYALGLCNDAEVTEVNQLCAQYPDLKTELDLINRSVEGYASSYAKTPPARIKENIFNQINLEEKETPTQAGKQALDTTRVVSLYATVRRIAVAAVALFLLSIGFNVILFNRLQKANSELTALNEEKTRLAQDFDVNKVRLESMEHDMTVVGDPNTMKVMMKGVEKSPASMAMIYWNKQSKEVFLSVKSLPAPDPGMQYQLWAIVDGKPVDAGMISMNNADSSMQKMKDFETAQAFAVTLEKEGGSPSPTMTEMYVMGAVSL